MQIYNSTKLMYGYTDIKLIHPPAKDSHSFALKPPRSRPLKATPGRGPAAGEKKLITHPKIIGF